jgi:glucose/arabinose dehydrogenase
MHRGFVQQRRPISGEGLLQFLETVFLIKKILLLYWVAVSGGLLFPGNLWSQTLVLEPILSGLTGPVYVTNAHDGSGRLFILEQEGRIKVLPPGATSSTLFLDLTSRVLAGGERGLLGLAFHPRFATNRRFFVNYTRKPDGATVIAEYHLTPTDRNMADTQEAILLTVPQPFANHNGGMIEFGPDGFLYIGLGDGGSGNDPGNRAQNTEDLLGKILRIDVDHPQSSSVPYSSPASNPFFGSMPGRDEIFALGLRNPWRFSFDS